MRRKQAREQDKAMLKRQAEALKRQAVALQEQTNYVAYLEKQLREWWLWYRQGEGFDFDIVRAVPQTSGAAPIDYSHRDNLRYSSDEPEDDDVDDDDDDDDDAVGEDSGASLESSYDGSWYEEAEEEEETDGAGSYGEEDKGAQEFLDEESYVEASSAGAESQDSCCGLRELSRDQPSRVQIAASNADNKQALLEKVKDSGQRLSDMFSTMSERLAENSKIFEFISSARQHQRQQEEQYLEMIANAV